MNYHPENLFVKRLPTHLTNATLENCPDLPTHLVTYGKQWAKTQPLKSLFLCGPYGSGKTWFAYAIIREFLKNLGETYFWPRCLTSKDLDAKLLQVMKDEGGDSEFIKELGEEDLLFIDDLGRETRSERLRNQYFEIFNNRYKNQLPTIVTSNFSPNQLGDLLDGSIISRMHEWRSINFPERDLRKEQSKMKIAKKIIDPKSK